jgi:DNA-binding LytR/AlgR family response regulator
MTSIRCIVVDDEPLAIKVLEKYFSAVPDLELSASFCDPLEALEAWRGDPTEVLFLDIQMPDLDGMSLAKLIRPKPLAVVFTTAHPEFAVESYELPATDYLLKPFSLPRFLQACEKIRAAIADKSNVEIPILVVKAEWEGFQNYEAALINLDRTRELLEKGYKLTDPYHEVVDEIHLEMVEDLEKQIRANI